MNALEFAINMELDGEKYYSDMAKKNEGNKLEVVFTMLASEEKKHAEMLKDFSGIAILQENPALSGVDNVFQTIEFGSKPELKMYIAQADLYAHARDKEKESVALYEKLLSETDDTVEQELFTFLVKQEQEHLALMEALVELMERSKKVVSAEFGLTNDY